MIRKATLLDVSSILFLLAEMHGEPEEQPDPVNWLKVTHIVTDAIGRGMVLLAVTEEDVIMGSLGFMVSTEWYSDAPNTADLWFYVFKEHRSSTAGFKLMKAFKKEVKEHEMPKIKVGHTLGNDLERMDKFYNKLGFERSGTLYREKR